MIEFKKSILSDSDNIYMGIDQSLNGTGIVIYNKNEDKVLFSTTLSSEKTKLSDEKNGAPIELRLIYIIDSIAEIIKKFNVQVVGIEGLAFNSSGSRSGKSYSSGNSNSSRQLSGLFFGIMCLLYREGLKYFVIAPKSVKLVATGSGNASKEEMVAAIDSEILEDLLSSNGFKSPTKAFFDIADAYHLCMYPIKMRVLLSKK